MQRRSIARKQKILKAARELLVEEGYEGMTFAKVSKRSRSAVGSILHFYKTKRDLAAAVAEEIIEAIGSDAGAALSGHAGNVERAVRTLIGAASRWEEKFPYYRRLIGYLDVGASSGGSPGWLETRLHRILADWSGPLIRLRAINALSRAQLYALVLAPVLCGAAPEAERKIGGTEWLELLSDLAVRGITPRDSVQKRSSAKPAKLAKANARDLFSVDPRSEV
jgi:AcrR family transcriptional regulator